MKTEKEIREEIKATIRTEEIYKKAYELKKIPKDVFINQIETMNATINALKWVLGENDRYD